MKLKKNRRFKKSTCFIMGIIGAGAILVAGVLLMLTAGAANLPQAVGFVLTGGMLLFLATTERGDENRRRRVGLVLLFFALLASYTRLPPLDVLEALVVPLVAVMYREKGDWPFTALLVALEAAFVTIRLLAITGFLGGPPWLLGAATAAVALARGAVLLRLCLRWAAPAPAEGETHSLRG